MRFSNSFLCKFQSRAITSSTINLILIEEELHDSDDEYDEEGRQYVEKLQKKSVSLIRATCIAERNSRRCLSNGLKKIINQKAHIWFKHSTGLLSQMLTIVLFQGNCVSLNSFLKTSSWFTNWINKKSVSQDISGEISTPGFLNN